jgi:hypothetical protein
MIGTVKAASLGGIALALGIGLAVPAQARVFVDVGIGVPLAVAPPWYYPPPAFYVPPPVAYVAPPVVYQQQPIYAAPQEQVWYYCNNPKGYYPYVGSCQEGWQTVPATPPRAER